MPHKKPYPRNKDIRQTIIEVLNEGLIYPQELIEEVKKKLEERGFYTGLVSTKRIWRLYEEMVRKGFIPDYLDVVKG